ncbi:MAG: hypothetical protein JJ958_06730 [Balneola sp.]|nr:hypothetical protein [Balneola sp.]
MSESPFIKLLTLVIDSAAGGMTLKLPYVDHSVSPPEEQTVTFRIGSGDKEDLITVLKRAANKQELEAGNPLPFDEARYYPDVDLELRKRTQNLLSDQLQKLQDVEKATERKALIKEIRMLWKDLKPNIKLSSVEFSKLAKAFRKINPNLSDDEIVGLFS